MKPSTEKKLDNAFSEYIRLRDADQHGECKCISCSRKLPWKNMDCGHFISRKHLATRFNEKNNNAQCVVCNRFLDGNIEGYEIGLIKKYGTEVIEELLNEHQKTVKISESEAMSMIREFKKKSKLLKQEKES